MLSVPTLPFTVPLLLKATPIVPAVGTVPVELHQSPLYICHRLKEPPLPVLIVPRLLKPPLPATPALIAAPFMLSSAPDAFTKLAPLESLM